MAGIPGAVRLVSVTVTRYRVIIEITEGMAVIIAFSLLLFLALLFALSLRGRTGHKGLAALRDWNYAHRGLHGEGKPENSMAAFRAALDSGYGIELDVRLMKDGTLAVIHDSSLKRTAGVDVRIHDLTAEDLADYRLEGTQERIPTLPQVLELFSGKAPMIIELKLGGDEYAELTRRVCEALEGYSGPYCIEAFEPKCLCWLRKNRPDIIRGQLAANYAKNKYIKVPWLKKLALTWNVCNFLTKPDFIAYRFSERNNPGLLLCRKLWKIQGVAWTLRDPKDHATAVKEGWIPIFENYHPQ